MDREVIQAMMLGHAATKAIIDENQVDAVNDLMDDIREQQQVMEEATNALSTVCTRIRMPNTSGPRMLFRPFHVLVSVPVPVRPPHSATFSRYLRSYMYLLFIYFYTPY
uniref:Vacuolar-sorting protein SNF7 n=1 Tax=Lygus hesperus TaxID=30085 RepID=A0A0A9W9L7_LYGHE